MRISHNPFYDMTESRYPRNFLCVDMCVCCVCVGGFLTSCTGRGELNCLGTFIGKSLLVLFDCHVQFLHLLVLDFPDLLRDLTDQSKVVGNQNNPSRKLDTRSCQRINRLQIRSILILVGVIWGFSEVT